MNASRGKNMRNLRNAYKGTKGKYNNLFPFPLRITNELDRNKRAKYSWEI